MFYTSVSHIFHALPCLVNEGTESLHGKVKFLETWECIRNHKREPSRKLRNFDRGVQFENSAANCFSNDSGTTVLECGMFVLSSDHRFAASPDRVFQGETCADLTNVRTNQEVQLTGQCLLEIKTRAEGQSEPLYSVTGAHVCQVQLQMKCAEMLEGALLIKRNKEIKTTTSCYRNSK